MSKLRRNEPNLNPKTSCQAALPLNPDRSRLAPEVHKILSAAVLEAVPNADVAALAEAEELMVQMVFDHLAIQSLFLPMTRVGMFRQPKPKVVTGTRVLQPREQDLAKDLHQRLKPLPQRLVSNLRRSQMALQSRAGRNSCAKLSQLLSYRSNQSLQNQHHPSKNLRLSPQLKKIRLPLLQLRMNFRQMSLWKILVAQKIRRSRLLRQRISSQKRMWNICQIPRILLRQILLPAPSTAIVQHRRL